MNLGKIFITKKIFFFQIFLTLYIGINLIGGERGLFSYFKKNTHEKLLSIKSSNLKKELESIEYKNKLFSEPLTSFNNIKDRLINSIPETDTIIKYIIPEKSKIHGRKEQGINKIE